MLSDPAPARAAGSEKDPKEIPMPKGWKQGESDGENDSKEAPAESECVFLSYHCRAKGTSSGSGGEVTETKDYVPSQFKTRDVFVALESEGLTKIPPVSGCGIFFHSSTSQWHSKFGDGGKRNCAPKWSPSLRSEQKALLIALLQMWKWYVTLIENESNLEHVARLQAKLDETPF